MLKSLTIAIDVMGGDHGAQVTVPASLECLRRNPDLKLLLVGDQTRIQTWIDGTSRDLKSRFEVVHPEFAIDEHQQPGRSFRHNKNSSMHVAVEAVKQNQADACVSAGNTGALLLVGRHLLKMVAGIERPAIVARLPAADKTVYILDVGANINCQSRHLFQFAVMGSVLASKVELKAQPRISLLNIGVEDYKGTEQIKLAAKSLNSCEYLNYCGFIEGSELFSGNTDVVVCDGFAGNVTIKTSEGVVNAMQLILHQQENKNWVNRIMGKLLSPVLNNFRSQINPNKFNGATFLGLRGTIVKSHGNTDREGFSNPIEQAIREVKNDIPSLIAAKIAVISPPVKAV